VQTVMGAALLDATSALNNVSPDKSDDLRLPIAHARWKAVADTMNQFTVLADEAEKILREEGEGNEE